LKKIIEAAMLRIVIAGLLAILILVGGATAPASAAVTKGKTGVGSIQLVAKKAAKKKNGKKKKKKHHKKKHKKKKTQKKVTFTPKV
jgi:hypothetical protein